MSTIILEFIKEARILNRQAKLLTKENNDLTNEEKEMINKIIINTSKSLNKLNKEIN